MSNAGNPTPRSATLDGLIDGVRYRVTFDSEPFDKGACRYAFKGLYSGDGRKNGNPCVTKIFIDEAARQYENYLPDQRASLKANEYAQFFNAQFPSDKPLRFLVPEMATVDQLVNHSGSNFGSTFVHPGDKILVEDFIEGRYEKFNSNGGWQSEEVAAIPAFSHFTYWKSNGQLLVCDIQGVRTPTGYTLTDPAVLSRQEGQFGPTDIGPSGMTKFFKSHRCTSVCSTFPMPEFSNGRRINRGRESRRPSTYTFMLDAQEREANVYFRGRHDLPAIVE